MKISEHIWMPVAVFLLLAVTGSAGDVQVTTFSAHDESYGLEVAVNGKGDRAFLEGPHPDNEAVYRTSFWFHPGEMNLDSNTSHFIFQAVGPNPTGAGKEVKIVEIDLKMKPGNKLKIRALSYSDAQPRQKKYATRAIRIDDKGWNHIQLEWRRSSSNIAPDGLTRLSVIGGARAGGVVEISGRVPDAALAVETVRMGAVRGVDAATFGSCYFDTIEAYRTGATE